MNEYTSMFIVNVPKYVISLKIIVESTDDFKLLKISNSMCDTIFIIIIIKKMFKFILV